MSAGVSHEPSQEVQCVVTFYHTINIENINVSKNTYLLTLDLCTFSKCNVYAGGSWFIYMPTK